MAVWSTTSLSFVNNSFGRFDAEFYKPENLIAFKKVTSKKHAQLSSLTLDGYRVVYENTKILPSDKVTTESVLFLQATNIAANGLSIDKSSIGFVDKADWFRYPKGRISPGELLIEVKGQAEKVTIVPETFPQRTLVSGSLFKLTINSEKISPWYVFVYFSTKHGKLLRDRLKTNTLIGFVSKPQLYSIPVFLPDNIDQQSEIASLAKSAIDALAESDKLFNQAKQLLESELVLDKLNYQKTIGYMARFSTIGLSDTFNANRIDAQCFAPEAIFYKEWLLKHTQCDLLGYLLQNTTKGRQQNETIDGTADYCSIKHINGRELTNVGKCFPANGTPLATANDLLLAITGATIGKIGIVKRYSQLTFSGDLLRLRVKPEINPHYLLFVLDHPLGQVQFNRWITGSTNGHLAPRDIKRVLVPRLKEEIETRIATLVEESLTKRVESESLLERAKTRVEQLIEEAVQA